METNADVLKYDKKWEKDGKDRMRELLFLMSLPKSKTKELAVDDSRVDSDDVKFILDHGVRTGWQITGKDIPYTAVGKSMCCLKFKDEKYEIFLDKEKFKEELLKKFKSEMTNKINRNNGDLCGMFYFETLEGCTDKGVQGYIPFANVLEIAEKTAKKPIRMKGDLHKMGEKEFKHFMEWVKTGLKEICGKDPGTRDVSLTLVDLSPERKQKIIDLQLEINRDKTTKRKLNIYKQGKDKDLLIRTKIPFERKPKNGVLEITQNDLDYWYISEILRYANGLNGLKELQISTPGDADDLKSDISNVLKLGLNRTWKKITFTGHILDNDGKIISKDKVSEQIQKAIKKDNLPYKIEIKRGEGKDELIFEDLRVPSLFTENRSIKIRFAVNQEDNLSLNTLKFDGALINWLKSTESKNAWKEFTEFLAEQPQIEYVNFSLLNNDADKKINELYKSIDEWERFLNIPGTIFRFISVESNDKKTANYENLKGMTDVEWHWDSDSKKGVRKFNDSAMVMRPKDKIAVTEVTESGRLLWNRTALTCLFNGSLWKSLDEDIGKNKNKNINIVDFTIGDPNTKWKFDADTKAWEDVWKYPMTDVDFIKNVLESKIKTVRVYEDCITNETVELLKNGKFKYEYINNRNGKRVIEITKLSKDEEDEED